MSFHDVTPSHSVFASSQRRAARLTRGHIAVLGVLLTLAGGTLPASAQAPADDETPASATADTPAPLPALQKPWVRLGQDKNEVWIHPKKKQVAVTGEVCLTKGYLEMFACILGTKEHESVIALRSKAFVIHTALLAVGAKPGTPAQWVPRYQPATGTKVKLEVEWVDADGKVQRTDARKWIRDLKTKKAMAHDWVFGGSLFWVDPETKKKFYRAEGGEVACVSNFPVAMLDLPIKSSQVNEELSFEAFTENIPKRRTPVRLYLLPELDEKKSESKEEK